MNVVAIHYERCCVIVHFTGVLSTSTHMYITYITLVTNTSGTKKVAFMVLLGDYCIAGYFEGSNFRGKFFKAKFAQPRKFQPSKFSGYTLITNPPGSN